MSVDTSSVPHAVEKTVSLAAARRIPSTTVGEVDRLVDMLDLGHRSWRVQRLDRGDRTVPVASSVVPIRPGKAGVTNRALAAIIVARYRDLRSLDEQAVEIEEATAIRMPRSSLAKWMIEAGPSIEAAAQELRLRCLSAPLLSAANVSVGSHNGGTQRLWLYVAEADAEQQRPAIAWFHIGADRFGATAKRELFDYAGLLHCEIGAGYDTLPRPNTIRRYGGWGGVETRLRSCAHAEENALIAGMLAKIDALRRTEAAAGPDPQRRAMLRRSIAAPLLRALRTDIAEAIATVGAQHPRLSATFTAIMLHWEQLVRFLDDPVIPFETVSAQETVRRLSTQRGWLLGHRPQLVVAIHTLIETCRLNGVDPETHLSRLLDECPGGGPARLNT